MPKHREWYICYEKLRKFEQHFKLVSRLVKFFLTRKSTDKNNMEVAQIF
jgi:hypothetical protein